MESQTTIKKLFHEDGIQFSIPAYQRAYSWEYDEDRKQIKQFIIDIREQDPGKNYFLGHFLFEKDGVNKYLVIDGQQRLTTVVIFFSCLIRELEKRESTQEKITDLNGDEIWRIRENYIQVGKRSYKFSTVGYDNSFFENLIFENNSSANVCDDSSSKKRINKAKKAFEDLFKEAEISDILTWKKIIDDATITTFIVENKIQATQIFAFQNDRGKDLTALEKLKAFIMHKIYSIAGNPEELIKKLEIEFSEIYRKAERVSQFIDEDRILNFHCLAYLSADSDSLASVKSRLAKTTDNIEKEEWIIRFVQYLKETFFTVEIIEKKYKTNNYIVDILLLDMDNVMPLLIKLYHYHNNDEDSINEIAKTVENILFKLKYTVTGYKTNNIPTIARKYKGEMEELRMELEDIKKNGFQWYWNFTKDCKSYFVNYDWHFKSGIKYVLWKYENYLRHERRINLISPEYYINKYGRKRLENAIDHITPQNPKFIKYTDEFKQKYLNNIGNLILMLWGNNSEKRNNNPVNEIKLYDSDYLSHHKVRDVLTEKRKWGEEEINQRKDEINEFIIKKWNLD
jgi:uncharacterized protein with ParB-like and HNH nuclease domain